jgi:hypothetical protein
MGLIKSTFDDIGKAVGGVAEGVGKVLKGGGELAAGALTLNPKEMEAGAKDITIGGVKGASNAVELTAGGLAESTANHLMDDAIDSAGLGGSDQTDGADGADGDSDSGSDGIDAEQLKKTKEFADNISEGANAGFFLR